MSATRSLEAERAAAAADVRAAEAEVADLRSRLEATRQAFAEVRARIKAERAAGHNVKQLRSQARALRAEVRRLFPLKREARQRLRKARERGVAARAEVHRGRHERVSTRAARAGVEHYFPPPGADGATWMPGYARKPKFLKSRRAFVRGCRELGGLAAGHRVLDVGCGIGGVAVFLVDLLGEDGSYVGLDVDERSIDVSRRNIGARHDNFVFDVMDVHSSKYNPSGRYQPIEYRFPFDDGEFDFAILRSVFTHMVPRDVDHYLAELARLLHPGGRTAITYFLLDEAAEQALAAGTADKSYPHRLEGYRLDNADVTEAAVAIDHGWVEDAYAAHGFDIITIEYGGWRDVAPGPKQDTVFAVRR